MKNKFLKAILALVICVTSATCCISFVGCNDNKPSNQTEVTSITLNKSTITLNQYASETLVATVTTTDTSSSATVTWGSLDESKVIVDNNGTVRGLQVTTSPVIVTAIAGNKIAICAVNVVPSQTAYEQTPSVAFSADMLLVDTTYTSLTTLQDGVMWFTASEATDGYVSVDASSKTIANQTYANRLKLSGKGSADARSIKLVLNKGAKIVLHCVSSSNKEGGERTVNLFNQNYEPVSGQTFNLEATSTPTEETLVVTAPGTYYIGTQTGGLNIYGIYIYYQV